MKPDSNSSTLKEIFKSALDQAPIQSEGPSITVTGNGNVILFSGSVSIREIKATATAKAIDSPMDES